MTVWGGYCVVEVVVVVVVVVVEGVEGVKVVEGETSDHDLQGKKVG